MEIDKLYSEKTEISVDRFCSIQSFRIVLYIKPPHDQSKLQHCRQFICQQFLVIVFNKVDNNVEKYVRQDQKNIVDICVC